MLLLAPVTSSFCIPSPPFPYIYFASLYLADPFSSFSLSLSFDSNDCPQQICTLLTRIYDTSFWRSSLPLSRSFSLFLFLSCCFNTCRIYFALRHECPLTPCRENIAFLSCSHSLFLLSKLIRRRLRSSLRYQENFLSVFTRRAQE